MTRQRVVFLLLMLTASACSIACSIAERSEGGPELVACGCGSSEAAPVGTAASVLIFGDAVQTLAVLRTALEALGHTVVVQPILPDDLLSFHTIWHVGNVQPLTAAERARLAGFVRAGGGLHLTGERPGGDTMNDSLAELLDDLVEGGGIQVGRLGDVLPPGYVFAPYPIQPDVIASITPTPHSVSNIRMKGPGGLAGIASDRNILAVGAGDVPVAAVWDSDDLACGTGAVSIIMDNGWFELIPFYANNRLLLEDLQSFLNRRPEECAGDGDGDGVPDGADICPNTIMGVGAIVDSSGCSIADLCPCGEDWKNHGAYVSCVAHLANDWAAAGLITPAEHGAIVSAAGRSECGHRR